jgi:DNA ligase-associated metallophosphoesterase
METGLETVLNGENVLLLPQRAIFWKAEASLILGDLHIGKDAHFRSRGIGIPNTATTDLERLSILIQTHQAKNVFLLGDVYHTLQPDMWERVDQWAEQHPHVLFHLIRGNHDRGRLIHTSPHLRVSDHPLHLGPFWLQHEPPEKPAPGGYVLCGHLHPCVTIVGKARMKITLPAFIFKPWFGILPAFGSFTGNAVVEVEKDDSVFAIANSHVLAVDSLSLKPKSRIS